MEPKCIVRQLTQRGRVVWIRNTEPLQVTRWRRKAFPFDNYETAKAWADAIDFSFYNIEEIELNKSNHENTL